MNTLDIVHLIEENPLTRLSRDYQNRFVRKIQERFTDAQQQLFVASFYCYLNYDQQDAFVIDVDEIWKWLGFARKDVCKRVIEKHFIKDKGYKILLRTKVEQKHGGNNKEDIFLTIDTFKSLCMFAKTTKGEEIREYYLKLENVYQELIKEESDELRQQLDFKDQRIIQVQEDSTKHKHNLLLQEFKHDCNIVYIMKVKTLGNKYVVRIGESRRGITSRYNEHKSKYTECTVLDCFSVRRCKDFEHFLHSCLSAYRYKQLPGHENELELFLVGDGLSYDYILQLVKQNILKYDDIQLEMNKYMLEIEKLKIENENLRLARGQNLDIQTIQNLLNNFKDDILQRFDEKLAQLPLPEQTDRFGGELPTFGPYVQQLNPDNLALVRVFQHIHEAANSMHAPRSSLAKAAKENTIYMNYRWNLVERTKDPNVVEDVQPTRQLQKQQNLGYIAKLNGDKTEILDVYLDRKTASIKNGYASVSYLDAFVKNGKPVDSYYYTLYDTVEQNVKTTFLNKHNLRDIVLYKKHGVGQYDMNGNKVNEYRSKYDCMQSLKIGQKTMSRAIETRSAVSIAGITYKFRYLEDKVSCVN